MNWELLQTKEQLDQLDRLSVQQPVMIYKHSTRCGVSMRMQSILEKTWKEQDKTVFSPWFLDLIALRELSNAIAQKYQVEHESPQVLLIKNGKCVYAASHHFIDLDEVRKIAGA